MVRRTSNRRKKMIGQMKLILMTAVCLVGLMLGFTVSGAEGVPDLEEGAKGTLEVTLVYTDTMQGTSGMRPMSGVQVKLAQIAGMQVENGLIEYTMADAYKDSGVALTGMNASEAREQAEVLAALTQNSDVKLAVTNDEGKAVFSSLDPGMYLVFQSAEANAAYHMDRISAFLLTVPYLNKSDGNRWEYTVEAYPKTEIPSEFIYKGTVNITKKTLKDNAAYKTTDVFYAGLFIDSDFTIRYGDIITLDMGGKSSITVPVEVNIGTSEKDSITLYITETDKDGRPLEQGGQEFMFSVNVADGAVTLTPSSPNAEIIITNQFTDEEQTEEQTEKQTEEETEENTGKQTEAQTEKATEKQTEAQTERATEKRTEAQTERATEKRTEGQTEKNSEKQTEKLTEAPKEKQTETNNPKTGDETQFMLYVVLMIFSAAGIGAAILFKRRRRSE